LFYFGPFKKQFSQIDPGETYSISRPDCRASRCLTPLVHMRAPSKVAHCGVYVATTRAAVDRRATPSLAPLDHSRAPPRLVPCRLYRFGRTFFLSSSFSSSSSLSQQLVVAGDPKDWPLPSPFLSVKSFPKVSSSSSPFI
jgi:hypothetical protein